MAILNKEVCFGHQLTLTPEASVGCEGLNVS